MQITTKQTKSNQIKANQSGFLAGFGSLLGVVREFFQWLRGGQKEPLGDLGSPIRGIVNRQKSIRSQFFSYWAVTAVPGRSARSYSNPSFRLLISDADRRAIACAEAIRSVTHLVLAPGPGSFSSFLLLITSPSWSFLRLTSAPNPLLRIQKTFSAAPCSFSWEELWFRQNLLPGASVQPVFDSRLGRIACKIGL